MTIEPPRSKVLLAGLSPTQRGPVERALTALSPTILLLASTTEEALAGLDAPGVELVIAGSDPAVDAELVLHEAAARRPRARRVRVGAQALEHHDADVAVPDDDVLAALPRLAAELHRPGPLHVEGRDDVLHLMLDVSLVPMLVCDPAGVILRTNARLDDLFGYGTGALHGRSVDELVPEGHRPGHAAQRERFSADPRPRSMAGRKVYGRTRLGDVLPLEVSLLPMEITAGPRVIVSVLDLRGRLEVDERMLRAQRLESLGLMIGGCVHDLRNLLFTLRIGIDAMRAEGGARDATTLVTAVESIEALSSDMMRLLEGRDTPPVQVDLNALIDRLEPMLRRMSGPRINLACVLSTAPCAVRGVTVQLEQVLINLVANARDALAATGGQITVSTARDDQTGTIVLRVEDDGPGMAPDVAGRVFEPFFTTKAAGRGTGLGLAVCRTVVERLGGHIDLETEPGAGCSFEVSLPPADR